MGCTLAGSVLGLIKKFKKEMDPDFVFIEPSEMVVAYRLKNVFLMGLRDVKYEVGPLISLVDGPDFDLNWRERNQVILNHVKETDLAVISRADLVDEKKKTEIRENLAPYRKSIPAISVRREQGLDELVSLYR